jgi:ankyrin repeat protein
MQTKQAQKVLSQIELDSFLETYIKMAEYGEAEKLLKKGAKLNLSIQEDGLTLLHQAVLNNDRQMLIFLLDNGVDPAVSNRVGKERARAIELVADTDWETYLIFATHGKDKGNARYDKALFNAILHDRCDVAEALLKAGASLSGDHVDDKYGRVKLIHVAAKIGNLNMVQLLLAYKADLASLTFHRKIKRGRAPIEILARYGHWDCVKWIADRTANTLTSEKYNFGAVLLDLAILTEENFKRQVEAANSKRPPEEALNQHAIAHSLLKAGANPNSWTLNGAHPLHYAASNGNSYLISLLLNYGANNAKQDSIQPVAQPRVAIQMVPENDWDSYTAFARYQKDKGSARYHIGLLSAILHGRVSLAGEFIKAGAKLSERYSDNESDYYLIHVAIEHGNIQMIDLLISASPNCLTFNRLDKKTAVSQKPMQILANKVEALENELAATRKKINELDHNLSKFDRESLVENERGIRKDLERYLHCIHWIAKKQRDTSEFYYDYGYALLTTVRHGYSNLALSLLQAGANPARRVDSTLDTPLHIAVIMKNLQMILLLLKFNPQAVRITNAAKKTPLQLASDMQDVAIINCFTHEDLKFETTDDKIVLANLYAALHQPLMEKDESENEEEKEREESKSQEK